MIFTSGAYPHILKARCCRRQVRICYWHYKKMRRLYPESSMGGFTRLLHRCSAAQGKPAAQAVQCIPAHRLSTSQLHLLHVSLVLLQNLKVLTLNIVHCSGEADSLMEEIPTALVDKLPLGLDQGFVVLNRPYGFLQWVRRHLPHLTEAYVLMIEPDYIFMRPPPLIATLTQSAAYHFTYMLPKQNRDIIEPYNEKGVPYDTILPTGAPLATADPAGGADTHSLKKVKQILSSISM